MGTGDAHHMSKRIPADRLVSANVGQSQPPDEDDLPSDLAGEMADDLADDLEGAADMGHASHLDADGQPRIVERRFTVAQEFHGYRLDHYLQRMIPRLSRTKIQQVVRTTLVRTSAPDRIWKAHTPVAQGEQWVIRRHARAEPPCPRDFAVLDEDDDVMVVDKPAGLPMHASAKFYFNTLTRVLLERYPQVPMQICHRLDRETSGIVVVAKHKAAARVVKNAFLHKRVQKRYIALVAGVPPWPATPGNAFRIDAPLRLATARESARLAHLKMVVGDGGLPSQTDVRVLDAAPGPGGGCALIQCAPITGRQHQLRAHLAHAGYPIIGDKLYAHGDDVFTSYCDDGLTDDMLAALELPRHALHAAAIAFPHPRGGVMRVFAPLPTDMRELFLRKTGRAPAIHLG